MGGRSRRRAGRHRSRRRILLELLAQCVDLIDEIEIGENEQERMIKLVEEFRAIPIITASELESWRY